MAVGEAADGGMARVEALVERFRAAGIDCRGVDDLARAQWMKLVWNVPFNGLAIAAGVDTQSILEDESLAYLARALMREVIGIARRLGHDLPSGMVEDQVRKTRGMGRYRPSSLIDFVEGREVETEAIWGEVVRRGFNAGAEVGRVEALYRLIQSACRGRRDSG